MMLNKVVLIACDNLYLTPYINQYIDVLAKNNVSYDIIFWDKNENETNLEAKNIFSFKHGRKNLFDKLFGYLCFRRFLLMRLKLLDYKCVVLFHSFSAFLIADFLLTNYKKRFIF